LACEAKNFQNLKNQKTTIELGGTISEREKTLARLAILACEAKNFHSPNQKTTIEFRGGGRPGNNQ
jgi:hypothetical protein